MKRLFSVVLVLCLGFCLTVSAHGGRTDAQGGHKDNANASGLGSYHYHHGYEAHLHPNGVCPYETTTEPAVAPVVATTPSPTAAPTPKPTPEPTPEPTTTATPIPSPAPTASLDSGAESDSITTEKRNSPVGVIVSLTALGGVIAYVCRKHRNQ